MTVKQPASDLDRAMALLAQDRAEEAVVLSAKAAEAPGASHQALAAHSQILKVLNRHAEALVFDQMAADRFPRSAVAWHNLAATLGDMGRAEESKTAIERGLARVEAGAQGGHKLARGYEPVPTWSMHWIADPGFRAAVADFLDRERLGVAQDRLLLGERTPFRRD